jgi:crotonobetainyl-CoA:carnitine CoA-transferase CaiB-like acyl-CoA transferase
MEKLGLGPTECLAVNPRLLYARMTGWGQTGPLARTAGHDLNYIGVSGALGLFKPHPEDEPPIPPLVGDMGGGGLFMAFGLLAGVISARSTGKGQVMDAAIIDGTATLYATIKSLHKAGAWPNPAGGNTIDGGRYFYRVYRCSDGLMVSVGAIEPAFRAILLEKLQLASDPAFANDDAAMEAERRDKIAGVFATNPTRLKPCARLELSASSLLKKPSSGPAVDDSIIYHESSGARMRALLLIRVGYFRTSHRRHGCLRTIR